ncbi:uncharacterized protein LOC100377248 [Saccoglossus kowalevskii]|uniref:Low-density lipoprotein receptor-related protein-like n=1 Tax=Saccoglossus kowalevskii TaxID=10224 RepID=A0ABM0GY70_SACKO|nr:PREDICTED: low-density lipoprotein receptor-related protein-like [Saccoglossus kowalevskii]
MARHIFSGCLLIAIVAATCAIKREDFIKQLKGVYQRQDAPSTTTILPITHATTDPELPVSVEARTGAIKRTDFAKQPKEMDQRKDASPTKTIPLITRATPLPELLASVEAKTGDIKGADFGTQPNEMDQRKDAPPTPPNFPVCPCTYEDIFEGEKCIPDEWVCDGWSDCYGGLDEPDTCPCAMMCNDTCIPEGWICDNWYDCEDMSDEANCTYAPCVGYQCNVIFAPQGCIPDDFICDGYDDCTGDGSDEAYCSYDFSSSSESSSSDSSWMSG